MTKERESFVMTNILGYAFLTQCVLKEQMQLSHRLFERSIFYFLLLAIFCAGTKWCGPGDVAQSYDDLGALIEVDKCCRAHDHCPIKVKGFASAHGLMNLSFYTK